MRFLAAALCLLSMTALAQDAGYARSKTPGGECLYISDKSFSWYLDAAGNTETPLNTEFIATAAAFDTWKKAVQTCSDFVFKDGGMINTPRIEFLTDGGVNQNVIIYRQKDCAAVVPNNDPCLQSDTCANTYNCWKHGSGVVALPTVTFKVSTGQIIDADLELNAVDFMFTTVDSPKCISPNFSQFCVATDVQNIMTSEIGRMIGLDHVSDPASTMAATTAPGETSKRVIDQGTRDGFCAIYPSVVRPTLCDGGSAPEPMGPVLDAGVISDGGMTCTGANCTTQKPGCGCSSVEPGTLALATMLLLIRASRRRAAGRA